MDDVEKLGYERKKPEFYKGSHSLVKDCTWNLTNQHLNKLLYERDAAIKERDRALLEKKTALDEREAAITQRNLAINERNNAILERDKAVRALHSSMNITLNYRVHQETDRTQNQLSNHDCAAETSMYGMTEVQLIDALRRTVVGSEANRTRQAKHHKEGKSVAAKPQHGKGVDDDLNKKASQKGLKRKKEWVAHGLVLNQVNFDKSVMPVPGCSCTGEFRQCYKWGNGGWQSSCCTTAMSVYPLPQIPNKRYARVGGRKMSGSVFTRLLSRLASEGYDFSVPVDLKDHWSKHGTNRYITIK